MELYTNPTIDCISDEQLLETAFHQLLERVTYLLSLQEEEEEKEGLQQSPLSYSVADLIRDVAQIPVTKADWLRNAAQTLCSIFNKSCRATKRKLLRCVAANPQFVGLTIKALHIALFTYEESQSKTFLALYSSFALLIASSLQYHPQIAEHIIKVKDQLCMALESATSNDVLGDEVSTELFLAFYLCLSNSKILQIFVDKSYAEKFVNYKNQLSSKDVFIRLLVKAIIARLIPLDTLLDDRALQIEVEDDEAVQAVSMLKTKQCTSCLDVELPLIPMLMDLSRSPSNMSAFVSRGVTSTLSELFNSASEEECNMLDQLIWNLNESESSGSSGSVANNGSLLHYLPKEGVISCEESHMTNVGFLSYVVEWTERMAEELFYPYKVVGNIMAAIALEHQLMEESVESLRVKRVKGVEDSSQCGSICSAMNSVITSLCLCQLSDTQKTGIDARKVVFELLLCLVCYSEGFSAELAKTGAVSALTNILTGFVSTESVAILIIKVLLHSASHLPAFNTKFGSSAIILFLLKVSNLKSPVSVFSKMLLALLNPLLTAKQLLSLKLTEKAANLLVVMLKLAFDSSLRLQGLNRPTILKCLISFTHQYSSTERSVTDKCSEFEKHLHDASVELQSNAELLANSGLLPVLAELLRAPDYAVQILAVKLVWCLAYNPSAKQLILREPGMIESLQCGHSPESAEELHLAAHCALWKLGLQKEDTMIPCLLYAEGCLNNKKYEESIEECLSIIESKDIDSSLLTKAKVLKGKALYYSYKRKWQTILLDKTMHTTKDGRAVIYECFRCMKEAISLLGEALDKNYLDAEASKVLDWTMIDCLQTANKLNDCHRCLLCRQRKGLRKSHMWPHFVLLENSKEYVSGLDPHRLKSSGEVTWRAFCERCEGILSQNGEDDFKKEFPKSGDVKLEKWLFSFCVGLVFRSILMTVPFPMHFNDSAVYSALLYCREHLLSLPVKKSKKLVPLEGNASALHIEGPCLSLPGIYLFLSPLNTMVKIGGLRNQPYPSAALFLSRNNLIHSKTLFFNGHVHFLLICCGPLTLVVSLDQISFSLEEKGFLISPDGIDSEQSYRIQSSEEELVKLLPIGVWRKMQDYVEDSLDQYTQVTRFFVEKDDVQQTQSLPTDNIPKHVINMPSNSYFPLSFLPRDFDITIPEAGSSQTENIKLPPGNQIILHGTLIVPDADTLQTLFLCIGKPTPEMPDETLYILLVSLRKPVFYTDCIQVDIEDGKLVLTKLVVRNSLRDLSGMQPILEKILLNKHFDNINCLLQLMKFQRKIKGPMANILPSLDYRCSSDGCWYCRDLCLNCMRPGVIPYSSEASLLFFCSSECQARWTSDPSQEDALRKTYHFSEGSDAAEKSLAVLVSGSKHVEQIIFSSEPAPNGIKQSATPYIIWHKKELKSQFISHFYISSDCLPLGRVWPKHIGTAEMVIAAKEIFSDTADVQQFLCKVLSRDSSVIVKPSNEICDPELKKATIQFFLPSGYAFCSPKVGLAHFSINFPHNQSHGVLVHWVDVEQPIHTTYLFLCTSVFTPGPAELYLITVQHHMESGWYLVDGAHLSEDGCRATKFLLDAAYTRRSYSLADINNKLEKVVPALMKEKGIPNFEVLLFMQRYIRNLKFGIRLDQKCLSKSKNCWYCEKSCLSCSFFCDPHSAHDQDFCSKECYKMLMEDPSASPFIVSDSVKEIPPVFAVVKKVVSLDSSRNAILQIHVYKTEPAESLHAICQIKTAVTQEVLVCALSVDYSILGLVLPSEHFEAVLKHYKPLLERELKVFQ